MKIIACTGVPADYVCAIVKGRRVILHKSILVQSPSQIRKQLNKQVHALATMTA